MVSCVLDLHGKKIIPVRAVTFASSRKFSCSEVAKLLAHEDSSKTIVCDAFSLERGSPSKMQPAEWDEYVRILSQPGLSLEEQLRNLPKGTFVYFDALQGAFQNAFVWPHHPEIIDCGRAGDFDLNENPRIEDDLVDLVFEGFSALRCLELASQQTPTKSRGKLDHDPGWQSIMDEAASELIKHNPDKHPNKHDVARAAHPKLRVRTSISTLMRRTNVTWKK